MNSIISIFDKLFTKYKIYLFVTLMTIILLTIVLGYKTILGVANAPMAFGGDATSFAMEIKSLIDNGWFYHNNYTGAPFYGSLYDFPLFENFHFFIIKIIILIFPNWVFGVNAYFILTFIFISVTATYSLKKMNFSDLSSITGAFIFNFLPYHFYRGPTHLCLSGYFMIPISTLICFIIVNDDNNLLISKKISNNIKIIIWLILIGMTGIYYAYFTCFFIVISWLYKTINIKKIDKLLFANTLTCLFIIIISLIINIIPNLIFWKINGSNNISDRAISDIQKNSLTISQMLLPISGHRFSLFSKIRSIYNSNALQAENAAATLGIFMSIGFIFLIFYLFSKGNDKRLKFVSILNISAVLLATIGGFSGIIALLFTSIRAYNRISVFIAFFSIVAFTWLLNTIEEKINKRKYFLYSKYFFLAIILLIAIFDQTSPSMLSRYNYDKNKNEYNQNKDFIQMIEKETTNNVGGDNEDIMIFQLPYMVYPENGRFNDRVTDYSNAVGYLFSKKLKWSYGAIKGRDEDFWIRSVSYLPTDRLIETVALTGFKGIWIDRWGYEYNELAELEEKLIKYSNSKYIESENKRFIFFDLDYYIKELRNNLGEEQFNFLKNKLISTDRLSIYNLLKGSKQYDMLDFSLITEDILEYKFNIDYINNPIKPSNVALSYDRKQGISISGWAVDVINDKAPYEVYVKLNDKYYSTRLFNRYDVADYFNNKEYIISGFEAYIPSEFLVEQNYKLSLCIVTSDAKFYFEIKDVLEFSIID